MKNLTIEDASESDVSIILDLLNELGRPKSEIDSEEKLFGKLIKNMLLILIKNHL